MTKLSFLNKLKKEEKLELVEPSEELEKAYMMESEDSLRAAKILLRERIYENSISDSYYAMYNSVLSLLFKFGIKCENHTAALILLDKFFGLNNLSKMLERAKKERIDKQYYTSQKNTVTES